MFSSSTQRPSAGEACVTPFSPLPQKKRISRKLILRWPTSHLVSYQGLARFGKSVKFQPVATFSQGPDFEPVEPDNKRIKYSWILNREAGFLFIVLLYPFLIGAARPDQSQWIFCQPQPYWLLLEILIPVFAGLTDSKSSILHDIFLTSPFLFWILRLPACTVKPTFNYLFFWSYPEVECYLCSFSWV